MKTLYFISGAMGVGKTTVCNILREKLPNSVLLEGDDCWTYTGNPSVERKSAVIKEIIESINILLVAGKYQNIIFCWVMHLQEIHEQILNSLNLDNCRALDISLTCSKNTLVERLEKDVLRGKRTPDVIERSIARLPLYEAFSNVKISTDDKTPEQVAQDIILLASNNKL